MVEVASGCQKVRAVWFILEQNVIDTETVL